MEYFEGDPEFELEPLVPRPPVALNGEIAARDLVLEVAGGIQLLKGVSLDIAPGQQVALVGFSGSGKSTLALCLCQILKYTAGSATLSGLDIDALPKSDIADNMAPGEKSPATSTMPAGSRLLPCSRRAQAAPSSTTSVPWGSWW